MPPLGVPLVFMLVLTLTLVLTLFFPLHNSMVHFYCQTYAPTTSPPCRRPRLHRELPNELHQTRHLGLVQSLRRPMTQRSREVHQIAPTNELPPVWPDPAGTVRGESFEPLHRAAPEAARRDPGLYELLALLDALRGGRARERKLARAELEARLLA